MEAIIVTCSLFFLLLILLLLALGAGESIFERTNLISNFKKNKVEYEKIRINVVELTFKELGNRRLEEIAVGACHEKHKQNVIWKIATLVWYKEQSLRHLYDHLKNVSGVFFILLALGLGNIILGEWDHFHTFKELAAYIHSSIGHAIPILEVITLVLVFIRIYGERESLKSLLEE